MGQHQREPEETSFHTIDENIAEELDGSLPDHEVLSELGSELKMVANSTRLRILCYLSRRDLCVHDLTTLLDLSQSAVSHQLQKLKDRGLVQRLKDGRVVYYSLNDEKLRDLLARIQSFFD